MKTIEKWWPHLYPKVKKIVAVKFEDGCSIQTDDAEVRGYLKCLDDETNNAALRKGGLASLDTVRAMHRAWITLQMRERASKPRKSVTRKQALAFKKKYEKDHHGKMRGWKKAFCLEVGINIGTLRNRMR